MDPFESYSNFLLSFPWPLSRRLAFPDAPSRIFAGMAMPGISYSYDRPYIVQTFEEYEPQFEWLVDILWRHAYSSAYSDMWSARPSEDTNSESKARMTFWQHIDSSTKTDFPGRPSKATKLRVAREKDILATLRLRIQTELNIAQLMLMQFASRVVSSSRTTDPFAAGRLVRLCSYRNDALGEEPAASR